jgi:hypothetical protein
MTVTTLSPRLKGHWSMKFQRFGNAFIAQQDDAIYVVSLYLGDWQAYYHDANMAAPEKIGLYGYGSPNAARQAAEEFASTLS